MDTPMVTITPRLTEHKIDSMMRQCTLTCDNKRRAECSVVEAQWDHPCFEIPLLRCFKAITTLLNGG